MVGLRRLLVILVVDGDVIEDVFTIDRAVGVHPIKALFDDRSEFEGERRVIGLTGRNGRREQQAVTVLVLKAFAHQRGPARRGPHQEAAGAGIGGQPREVTDALEAEHRIEGVEGHHRHAGVCVAGAGGDPRRHRTGLGDALLEQLAIERLGVGQQQVVVDRFVQLAARRVDLELAKQRIHPEGAGLIGHDRHDTIAELLIAQKVPKQRGERHCRGDLAARRPLLQLEERCGGRGGKRATIAHDALRDEAVERPTPLDHVLVLLGVRRGAEVRRDTVLEAFLGDLVLHVQPLTEFE